MDNLEKLKDKAMSSHHREVLRQNRVLLTDDIDPEVVCNYLLQDGIISPTIYDEVLESRATRRTRNSYLLNILESRSDAAFYCLLKAIKEGSGQSYLVKKLERDDANKSIRPRARLRQSNSLPNVFPARKLVSRKLSVNDLETASEESDDDESSESDTSSESADDSDVEQVNLSDEQYLNAVKDEVYEDLEEEEGSDEEYVLEMSHNSSVRSEAKAQFMRTPNDRVNSGFTQANKVKQENGFKTFSKAELVPLPSVSSLFRYVAPHIHSRWKELAYELGLTDEDISDVHVIPFDRPSKYATTVLEKWARLNKGRASKSKLTEVLTKMNIKKALETIEKFKINSNNMMKYKQRNRMGNFTCSIPKKEVAFTLFEEEKNYENPLKTRNRKRTIVPPKPKLRPMRYRHKGEIQAHCNVQVNMSPSHGEKVFLDMAPKIMDAMIQRGEEAKNILNNLKELRGIVCTDVRRGSVVIVLAPLTLSYMEHLQALYDSGQLKIILTSALFMPEIKQQFPAEAVSLTVDINRENFDECRQELAEFAKVGDPGKHSDTGGDVTLPCGDSVIEPNVKQEDCQDPFVQKLFHGLGNLTEYMSEMSRCISLFQSSCSSFLLTLNLVQPTDRLTINNLDELRELHELCKQSNNVQIQADLVQQFLNLHARFKNRIDKLDEDIYTNIKGELESETKTSVVNHYGMRVLDVMDELKIMLDSKYDFSGLSHPNLPKLVIREKMRYQGLLSYLLVLCDMLKAIKKALRKLIKYL